MAPLRIAIVGFGKIAADQHEPAIDRDPRFELAASVSRSGVGPEGIRCFRSHGEMLDAMPDLDAAAICTPPAARYEIARDCILAGLHVLLEKPPAASLGEAEALALLADQARVTFFTTWHAQYNRAVSATAALLAHATIESLEVVWREDVRKWHPGQDWIWQPGGFGVFDPGINAFSIVTRILPQPLFVRRAELFFPANRQAPIAATIDLASPAIAGPATCLLDWRHAGDESWTIRIATESDGELVLSEGGKMLSRDGEKLSAGSDDGEYPGIYDRFAALIASRASHVDVAPLRIAADAFMLGKRSQVAPFEG